MNDRLKYLLSPPFIFCLLLLIINDFFLKPMFHNEITGKLSDLCGLFIFPIFWSVLLPRYKLQVFILTGLLFMFWKSEYASGMVAPLKQLFNLSRTVDLTDLFALPVMLLAWFQLKKTSVDWPNNIASRIGATLIAALAIFSFCATSQQRYTLSFEQPQYVLLGSALTPDSSLYDEFAFYKQDSLLIVKLNYVYTARPVRQDDYHKNHALKDIEQDVRARLTDSTSLIPKEKVTLLSIPTAEGIDTLRFKGGRLDGRFTRTKDGRSVIKGYYKMGLENGTWTFRDSAENITVIKTFLNGECTSIKRFEDSKRPSLERVNTRAITIRNTYFQLAILFLLAMGTVFLLIRNYRERYPEQLELKTVWKCLICLASPFLVWLSHMGIGILLLEFEMDIFEMMGSLILIFILTCPLMFVIVFLIKLRKEIDILLYCLLFTLLSCVWSTCMTIIALSN